MGSEYLEPRTDVAAADDWSTRMSLAESRWGARVLGVVALVCSALTVVVVVVPETSAGSIAVAVLLGLFTGCASLGPLWHWMLTRPLRIGLLAHPWRRLSATVAATGESTVFDRLLVFDDSGALVVRGVLTDLTDMVAYRREVFLCGPGARGRVAIRVAGLCQVFVARVVAEDRAPGEREPHRAQRPVDHPAVALASRRLRRAGRGWLWLAGAVAAGVVVLLLSLRPAAPVGFVGAGVLLTAAALSGPGVVVVSGWYRRAAESVCTAAAWTPVPVTLLPWEPGAQVAGIAQLPNGPGLVRFPVPDLDVVANIADTGTMWVAGEPGAVIAVGLPHLPVLTAALLDRHGGGPGRPRQPLALRGRQPALREMRTSRG